MISEPGAADPQPRAPSPSPYGFLAPGVLSGRCPKVGWRGVEGERSAGCWRWVFSVLGLQTSQQGVGREAAKATLAQDSPTGPHTEPGSTPTFPGSRPCEEAATGANSLADPKGRVTSLVGGQAVGTALPTSSSVTCVGGPGSTPEDRGVASGH